jgi:acyl phosphate:glycerol-3-phosphate acyltransferase
LVILDIFKIIVALVAAYLIGSFPTAYLVSRYGKGVDIRDVGSHNLGAMNVFYSLGFVEGMIVLLTDIGKGAAGVFVAELLHTNLLVMMFAGAMVVVGHAFPVFLKFRGGKGGAACIGILMYFMPWGVPIYLGTFLILLAILRVPTISYSLAFFVFPLIGWLINRSWEFVVYSLVLVLLPLAKYIPRLFEMRRKGGSWKHVLIRKSVKDRF